FEGSYLFADYNCGRIFRLTSNGSGGYDSFSFVSDLGGSSAVAMLFGPAPSGPALYYTTYAGGGQVRRIRFTGQLNYAPQAVLVATPDFGPAPLEVAFDGGGT